MLMSQMLHPYDTYTYFVFSITCKCQLRHNPVTIVANCLLMKLLEASHTGRHIEHLLVHFLQRCRFVMKNVQSLKTSVICNCSGMEMPACVFTWLVCQPS